METLAEGQGGGRSEQGAVKASEEEGMVEGMKRRSGSKTKSVTGSRSA